MNIMEDLALHLDYCGLGTLASAEQDGDIHWGRMPDSPDDCICVFSTDSGVGGPSPARFQIMCRAKSARKAYETAYAVGQEFDGFGGFLHGDGRRANCDVVNAATGMGADTKKREIYVTNITVRYCDE